MPPAAFTLCDDARDRRSPVVVAARRTPVGTAGRSLAALDVTGPLRHDGEWATVGDRGRAVPGGWVVLGRGDAAISTGGHTVVAEEVEAAVAALPGVRDVAVVGWPHEDLGQVVAAVVVVEPGTRRAALDRALRHLPAASRPRRWLVADQLPRTPGGKLARGELGMRVTSLAPLG